MLNYKLLIDEIIYEKELSYSQMAILADLPKSTLYKICKGKKEPKLSELIKIADALNMEPQKLWDSENK